MLRPGTIVDRYVVEGQIGRGGNATVFAVRHRILGTPWALKVLRWADPQLASRLIREGRVQAGLDPTHVVPVTDVLDIDGTPALLMPLIVGCSLAELLQVHTPDAHEAAELLQGILAGIRAAHASGVVHRDLKPGNVLLELGTDRLVPRVSDFGLARAIHTAGSSPTGREPASVATREGSFVGTLPYAAPEQLTQGPIGPETDLWALGVIVYELATGHHPFLAAPSAALAAAIERADYDRARLTGPWVELVDGLLRVDPAARLPAAAVARTLSDLAPAPSGLSGLARVVRALPPPSPQPPSEPTVAFGPTILPVTATPERDGFVGRRQALEVLDHKLAAGRLVSVVGLGGIGKSRLALHLVRTRAQRWPGGWWSCDLSQVTDLDGITSAVARALDVPLGADPVDQLGHALAARGRCLLVLDHFDRVVELAEATVGRWLNLTSQTAFVVTSRQVLALTGEEVMALDPLEPDDALALFVQRSEAAGHRPADHELAAIEDLVRLLDFLPLAIELAAGRVRVMPVAQILSRMGERFRLLTRPRDVRSGATLWATLDSSWELLHPDERAALAQLSVFEGRFSLVMAEELLSGPAWAVDVVQSLVDRSLVRRVGAEQFDLLASVREFAAEHLQAGERLDAERRHGASFARYGSSEWLERLHGSSAMEQRRPLTRHHPDLIAASRRAVARDDGAIAAATALAAWEVFELCGPLATGVALLESAVPVAPAPSRRRLLLKLARGLHLCGRTDDALHHLHEIVGSEGGGVEEVAARSLLGSALSVLGRIDEGRRQLDTALDAIRESGTWLEAEVLLELARIDRWRGELASATVRSERALAIARAVGHRPLQGAVLLFLANLALLRYRSVDALAHHEAARGVFRELGDRRQEALALANLGSIHYRAGRFPEAIDQIEAALVEHRAVGSRLGEVTALCNIAAVHSSAGRFAEADRLLDVAAGLLRDMNAPRSEALLAAQRGLVQVRRGELDAADASNEAALAIIRALGDRDMETSMLVNSGIVHMLQGRFDDAMRRYDAAFVRVRESGDRRAEALVFANVAELHLAVGRLDEARTCIGRAEEMLRRDGHLLELGQLLGVKAELEHRVDDPEGCDRALAEIDALAVRLALGPDSEVAQTSARVRALRAGQVTAPGT